MVKILIAGCGKIGLQLAKTLSQNKHEVYGLKRSSTNSHDAIDFLQADLSQPDTLAKINFAFDIIVFSATPDQYDAQAYQQTYVTNLQNLLQACTQQNQQPFIIFLSSTSVYGQQQGEWVDENSTTQPERYNGQTLLQAESLLQHSGFAHLILRVAGIYGVGRNRLIKKALTETAVQYEPVVYSNRIHQHDVVSAIHFLIQKYLAKTTLQNLYLLCDDQPAASHAVINYIRKQHGLAKAPKTTDVSQQQNKQCSNQRLKQLGWQPVYASYLDGYANNT